MVKKLSEKEIRTKIKDKGYIRILIVFELVGTPKDHVETTIKNYMANLKSDSRIEIINEDYADTVEQEDGMFSTFVEAELLVSSMDVLTWLAINFSPASIEVIEPNQLVFKESVITGWYNDLISKMHEISTVLRQERNVNQQLIVSVNSLIKNALLLSVKNSDKTIDELARDVGIIPDQLLEFVNFLVEKKKIVKKGDKYGFKKD